MKKEIRNHTVLDKRVQLNKEVVVSDPCYTLDTWCQALLKNVKPGEYIIEYYQAHDSWDGHAFCLTHSKYKLGVMPKEKHPATLGIDAGMVGVFPLEEYRNNSIVPDDHQYQLKVHDFDSPGEKWYCAVIPLRKYDTKRVPHPDYPDERLYDEIMLVEAEDNLPYRLVGNCFNSDSGYGDGYAELRVSINAKGEVYRIAVVF